MKHHASAFNRFCAKAALACAAAIPGIWSAQASAYSTTTEPFSGITLTTSVQAAPNALNFYLLTIDLSNPNISFAVTPKNTRAGTNGIPDAQTTPAFVSQVGAQAGINANLFSPYNPNWSDALKQQYPNGAVSGIAASDGSTYGTFDHSRPSLNISSGNVLTFLNTTVPAGFSWDNAVSGSDQIVKNGVNIASATARADATGADARTAVGITADNKMLVFVADKGTSSSIGLTTSQEADLLIAYGAVNALNVDGGGSSTMVLRPSTSANVINHPSDGSPRSVKVNLGVFAAPATQQQNLMVYNDFYGGDQGTFHYAPTASGSTAGVLNTSTNTAVKSTDAVAHGWFDRLSINDDPSITSVPDHPGSGWFVRMISGANANQSDNSNTVRPTTGYIGYWARTTTPGVLATIALDDANNVTADRGVLQSMIADGQWHLYQWNLQDDSQWTGWVNGDGHILPNSTFTIDSLQFFGPNANAIIDIDMISQNALGPLGPVPEPGVAMMIVALAPLALLRRRRKPERSALRSSSADC